MHSKVYTLGQIGTPPPPAAFAERLKVSRGGTQPVKAVAKKKGNGGRGSSWTFCEKRAAVYAVTATNQEYCDGRPLKERYVLFNKAYAEEVRRMYAAGEWVNQFGEVEDKTTPEKSILDRCVPVMTDTRTSPIHLIVEQVLKVVRSTFNPQLDKLLDSQGKIRSGQQGPDVKEQFRLLYYEILQAQKAASLAKKAAKTKGDASKAKDSSSSSGEDDDIDSPPADKGNSRPMTSSRKPSSCKLSLIGSTPTISTSTSSLAHPLWAAPTTYIS